MTWDWIHQYQVVLFDFDGLLVNTEDLHLAAYRKMCADRGYQLNWDFQRFCSIAHFSSGGLEQEIYKAFPALYEQEPRWQVLYEEKKSAYMELLEKGSLVLLPGVESLLEALQKADIRRAVVTNSTRAQVEKVKSILPALKTIPLWITREDYKNPKPSPECYQKAKSILAKPGEKVIGFEDSLRGVQALLKADVQAILICPKDHPQLQQEGIANVPVVTSFLELEHSSL